MRGIMGGDSAAPEPDLSAANDGARNDARRASNLLIWIAVLLFVVLSGIFGSLFTGYVAIVAASIVLFYIPVSWLALLNYRPLSRLSRWAIRFAALGGLLSIAGLAVLFRAESLPGPSLEYVEIPSETWNDLHNVDLLRELNVWGNGLLALGLLGSAEALAIAMVLPTAKRLGGAAFLSAVILGLMILFVLLMLYNSNRPSSGPNEDVQPLAPFLILIPAAFYLFGTVALAFDLIATSRCIRRGTL